MCGILSSLVVSFSLAINAIALTCALFASAFPEVIKMAANMKAVTSLKFISLELLSLPKNLTSNHSSLFLILLPLSPGFEFRVKCFNGLSF